VIDVVESVVRALAWIFGQIILEMLIQNPGFFILKRLIRRNNEDIDPNSPLVILCGVLFWAALLSVILWVYQLQ
jgi:hypothetical protein